MELPAPDLNATQVLKVLNISRAHLYQLLNSGQLKAHRISAGGPLRFRQADLEAFRNRYIYKPGEVPRPGQKKVVEAA